MCESPSVSQDDEKPGVGQSEYLTSRVAYLGLVRRTRRPAATPTPSNTDNAARSNRTVGGSRKQQGAMSWVEMPQVHGQIYA